MSLNPSNSIAARMNPDKTVFPNLARRTKMYHQTLQIDVDVPGVKAIYKEVDDTVRDELVAAGVITAEMAAQTTDNESIESKADVRTYLSMDYNRKGEVPCSIIAFAYHWKFERRWCYYACEGAGIPPQLAEEFHQKWGTQVRVGGDCGCPSPVEACHGFAVGSYHIDTTEGLKAFVELLESVYIPSMERV